MLSVQRRPWVVLRRLPAAALVGSALLGGLPGAAPAQGVEPVLQHAERAYRQMSSLTANFTQTITNPMLGGPETTYGTLYLRPPDRFAMRFSDPEGERIVADGTWLWLYAPSSAPNQVIKQPIPQSGAQTPNLIAQFVDRPLERYEATLLEVDTVSGEVVDVVYLVPRHEGLGFTEAEIAVARRDGLVRRIALVEPTRQRRRIVLHQLRTNVPVAERELRFDVPRGMRVVTP